jgi:hypothetical protein
MGILLVESHGHTYDNIEFIDITLDFYEFNHNFFVQKIIKICSVGHALKFFEFL